VEGVIQYQNEIDQFIKRVSSHWKINRMSRVDRNIIRIAVFELLYCDDIPFKVSINEAVNLGKKYGTEESGAFINGILDSIHMFQKQTQ
jgi:N utilization substance protein B